MSHDRQDNISKIRSYEILNANVHFIEIAEALGAVIICYINKP